MRFDEKLWTALSNNGTWVSEIIMTTLEPCTYRRWPDDINVHLWQDALHNATDIRNASTNIKGKQTPIALCSNIDTQPKLRDFHPFGSPVYVLDATMQSRQKLSKWKEKTGVGVNFCQSPSHAQSVSLVLNLLTKLEYHILHDDKFEIIKGALVPNSQWQCLTGLKPLYPILSESGFLQNTDSSEAGTF
jgi:hypothetical protein